MQNFRRCLFKTSGQSLIEYLVIVALVAVASLAVMRVVGQNVQAQFTTVSRALTGEGGRVNTDRVERRDYRKRDLGDFYRGSGSGGRR